MSNALLAAVNKIKFGVEELLEPDAQVFFENIFSTRHIGRVVDFMLFQCQPFLKASQDPAYTEYRFRHMIELAIFNAWANYRTGERSRVVELEFGWDKQRLVISASHIGAEGIGGFVPGAEPANEVSIRMQKMLTQVQALADGLIVRHDPVSGRVQAIAFLAADETEKLAETQYLDLSQLPAVQQTLEPDASVPEELSNGDIEAFMADENAAPEAAAPIEDDVTIAGGGAEPDTTETRIKGSAPEAELETRISGSSAIGQDKTKIVIGGGGDKFGEDKTKTVISGGGSVGPNKEVMQVKRLDAGAGAAGGSNKREQLLMEKLKVMSEQINALKAEKAGGNMTLSSVEAAGPTGDSGVASKREQLLTDQKKVMGEQIVTLNEQLNTLRSEKNGLQVALSESNRNAAEAFSKAAAEDDKDSDEVVKIRDEIEKEKGVPEKAKAMVQGLLEATTKERGDLKQRAREIDAMLRRRDYEYKTKESGFVEQLRLMEGMIKQRESALEKSKEAATNLSAIIEKHRVESSSATDTAEMTHKLATADKLLQAEKENTDRVQKRCDDIQKKLSEEVSARGTAQLDSAKFKKLADDLQRKVNQFQEAGQKGSSTDLLNITDARDKAVRQVEQLKQQNRELQTKLLANAPTKSSANSKDGAKNSPAQSEAELKHKLELADKLAKASKEELDKTKKRFDEVKVAENKLRGELSKVQADLIKAQAELKAAGIRSAGAAAAAAKTTPPPKPGTKPKT